MNKAVKQIFAGFDLDNHLLYESHAIYNDTGQAVLVGQFLSSLRGSSCTLKFMNKDRVVGTLQVVGLPGQVLLKILQYVASKQTESLLLSS